MSAPQKQTPGWSPANADTNAENTLIVGGQRVDRKTVATYAAKFALAGSELHVIRLTSGREYFEVRRWGQARMFGTVHDLQGFLTQIGEAQ